MSQAPFSYYIRRFACGGAPLKPVFGGWKRSLLYLPGRVHASYCFFILIKAARGILKGFYRNKN